MSTSARRVGAPTPRLLSAILDVNDGSPFVVLRNAEELPAELSGRDLDVALVPGVSLRDATRFLLERAKALGWQGVCLSTRAHMTGVTFLHEDGLESLSYPIPTPPGTYADLNQRSLCNKCHNQDAFDHNPF